MTHFLGILTQQAAVLEAIMSSVHLAEASMRDAVKHRHHKAWQPQPGVLSA